MGSVHNVEEAKRRAAEAAVKEHWPKNPTFIGIGSGTTIVYVVEAIKALDIDTKHTMFVPTGYQSKQLISRAGLIPLPFDSLPDDAQLDIAFDGADEVDEDLNCIKGGGACLFQEKLVAMRAKEFICVAGWRPRNASEETASADIRQIIENSSRDFSQVGPQYRSKWRH
jgi:ribose 5-phosphate isomerase A